MKRVLVLFAAAALATAIACGGQPAGPKKLRFALILGGLSAFAPMSVDMYLPAFPAMTTQLNATQPEIQLTLTAFVISLAVGAV